MNCDDIRPELLDYVMEEVPADRHAAMAKHLETCAACSGEAGKIRQTLGIMAQGAAFEEPPERIRVVAEPTNRWAALWRNPARLAFAGGAAACITIAILALARASVRYDNGTFEIAFGAAAAQVQSPAAASLPQFSALAGETLTRREAAALVAEALSASEARQREDTSRLVEASLKAFEEASEVNRINDRQALAETFRYFQAAQVNMWKQQVENQQLVSALVQRTGMEVSPRP
jgi:hypothetical protein